MGVVEKLFKMLWRAFIILSYSALFLILILSFAGASSAPYTFIPLIVVVASLLVALTPLLWRAVEDFLNCRKGRHELDQRWITVEASRGGVLLARTHCTKCGESLKFAGRAAGRLLASFEYEGIHWRVSRASLADARQAVENGLWMGRPRRGDVKAYVALLVLRQVEGLTVLARPRPKAADAQEILKELGLRLEVHKRAENSRSRMPFELALIRGRNALAVRVEGELKQLMRQGYGHDLIEVRVVEVKRNVHANQLIALIQLLGKALGRRWVLDTVVVGRDSSGPWLARAPPDHWTGSLEDQLRWVMGLEEREVELHES